MMKKGFPVVAITLLTLTIGFSGCLNDITGDSDDEQEGEGNLYIASWNLQIFGQSKASNETLLNYYADKLDDYDILIVQEIRDASGTAIETLAEKFPEYEYIISERAGQSSSKEQYAFFYKTTSIQVEGAYTYNEAGIDSFHREPYIAKFKAKNGSFDFVLINIHTDPDEATSEINALPLVITDAQNHFPEPDVILLGDLNADCKKGTKYFDENDNSSPLRQSGYTWQITNNMDTNVATSSCTYDRIITTSTVNQDYAGSSGVFRFDQHFELDCEPKKVSDKIAYLGRDIEDALTMRILTMSEKKELLKITQQFGGKKIREINNTILIHNFMPNIITFRI